jgi:hypothetical protein
MCFSLFPAGSSAEAQLAAVIHHLFPFNENITTNISCHIATGVSCR